MSKYLKAMHAVFVAGALGLAACGHSGSRGGVEQIPNEDPQPPVEMIVEAPALAARHLNNTGGIGHDNVKFNVGDYIGNLVLRGVLAFGLDDVPPDAEITSAVLTLWELGTVGSPAGLGQLTVQHVDLGDAVDVSDFDSPARADLGHLSSAAPSEWTLDVTAALRDDMAAGRDTADFRIQFSHDTDGNDADDYITLFGPGVQLPDRRPTLVITYQMRE